MDLMYRAISKKSQNSARDIVRDILLENPKLLKRKENKKKEYELLQLATHKKFDSVVELLVEFGEFGNPLKIVISYCNLSSAELLLKNGSSLNGLQWEGKSPIEYIRFRSYDRAHLDMVKLLVKYGLDIKYRNQDGKNLLHMVILRFDKKCHHPDAVEIARTLIKAGVSVDEIDNFGWSPLFDAVEKGNSKLVSFLVQNKADVHRKDNLQLTALHLAAQGVSVGMVDLLLSKGVDINAKNYFGHTALHRACRGQQSGQDTHISEQIISLLMKKGADTSVQDNHGNTPFSLLKPGSVEHDQCISVMVKEFATLNLKNLHVSKIDMDLINADPKLREYYEKCTAKEKQRIINNQIIINM